MIKVYFLQFNKRNSSIVTGKIIPQKEAFEYFVSNGILDGFCLFKDISDKTNATKYKIGDNYIEFSLDKHNLCQIIQNLIKKRQLYNLIYKYVISNDFTHIYIRRPSIVDFNFVNFISQLYKSNIKIIYDIPTYPYDDELSKVKLLIDKVYRSKLKQYVSLIASPSPIVDGDKIFGIPFINVPNGVIIENIKECESTNYPDDSISAIAVAGLSRWHGYDRFIEGLHNYYTNGGIRNIVLNIVGGNEKSPIFHEYKVLVEKYKLEKHVILHGSKYGEELDGLYDKCNIGIASLAFHRTNIYRSSALKTREYLAKGLPIYASTRIDILPENGDFIHYCKEDDSPIEMDDFIKFYDSVYLKEDSYKNVHDRIRDFARKTCDIRELMKPLIEKIIVM